MDQKHHVYVPEFIGKRSREVTDLEIGLVRTYTPLCLFFPTPAELDKDQVVTLLIGGLEELVSNIPCWAGSIGPGPDGHLSIVTEGGKDSIILNVKHLDDMNDTTIPSFEEYENRSFPPSLIQAKHLHASHPKMKASAFLVDISTWLPIWLLQLTFIRGGIVLGMKMNHAVLDGTAGDIMLSAWATNCRKILFPSRFRAPPAVSMDRSALHSSRPIPNATRMIELEQFLRDTSGYSAKKNVTPVQLLHSKIASAVFHVARSSLSRLKAQTNGQLGANEVPPLQVTSYDSLMAVLWRCIVRSRLPLGNFPRNGLSRFGHPVDLRKVKGMGLPPNFLGLGCSWATAGPFTISELLSENGVSTAARAIRESILAITPGSIQDVLEWSAGLKAAHQMPAVASCDFQLGPDVVCTSWTDTKIYTPAYDWGFGIARGARCVEERFEMIFVMPRKTWVGDDEGWEVVLTLEEGCMKRFLADPELRKWVEVRDPKSKATSKL